MEINRANHTETVAIEFWVHDELGNVQLKRTEFKIPMNTGPFSASAMTKGYIEYFMRRIRGAAAGAREMVGIEESLKLFEQAMQKAVPMKEAPNAENLSAT